MSTFSKNNIIKSIHVFYNKERFISLRKGRLHDSLIGFLLAARCFRAGGCNFYTIYITLQVKPERLCFHGGGCNFYTIHYITSKAREVVFPCGRLQLLHEIHYITSKAQEVVFPCGRLQLLTIYITLQVRQERLFHRGDGDKISLHRILQFLHLKVKIFLY